MENLQKQVANIEESLQHLTDEEIDGQLAVIKVGPSNIVSMLDLETKYDSNIFVAYIKNSGGFRV